MAQHKHKVFMIGWEYPPHNSGGLGVACKGLTHALASNDTDIHFSLPYEAKHDVSHMNIHNCVHENWKTPLYDKFGNIISESCNCDVPPFFAYSQEAHDFDAHETQVFSPETFSNTGYSFDLAKLRKLSNSQVAKQVSEYAEAVGSVGHKKQEDFEVIHAHDWMSFPAGQELRKRTGKPLVTHVHSTEFDRSGLSNGNPYITAIEYEGMHQADHVIAVSHYTKRLLEQKYGVDPQKISVVHNGIADLRVPADPGPHHFASKRPVIVFMGRLTIQKGVSYFLDLAHAVLKKIPQALFVVAGHGDMYQELLLRTADNGLSASVVFSGFVRNKQRRKLLDRADVFVMPSISEPFGLVALEAAQRHTPVIVSKNAGVSEVLPHAIALDFWDVNKMADSIVEIISDDTVAENLVKGQLKDLSKQTWHSSAQKVKDVYTRAFLGRKAQ